jgi:predicted nucleic acid-binding protein
MPKYVVDTNLYVRATRSAEANGALEAFYASCAPFVYLHSVVAGELLAGAASPDVERMTQVRFIAPFEGRGRVITPTHAAWRRAGLIVAALVRQRRLSPNGIQRSFLNDCLLASSAREHGYTIITENERDFALIRSVAPVETAPPFPERS